MAQTPRPEWFGDRGTQPDLGHRAALLANQHRHEIAGLVTDGGLDARRTTRTAPDLKLPAQAPRGSFLCDPIGCSSAGYQSGNSALFAAAWRLEDWSAMFAA